MAPTSGDQRVDSIGTTHCGYTRWFGPSPIPHSVRIMYFPVVQLASNDVGATGLIVSRMPTSLKSLISWLSLALVSPPGLAGRSGRSFSFAPPGTPRSPPPFVSFRPSASTIDFALGGSYFPHESRHDTYAA